MFEKQKAVINSIRETIKNPEQVRKQIIDQVETAKNLAQGTATHLIKESKNSPIVQDYLVPLVESEKAEKAWGALHKRLGENKIFLSVDNYRKEIIDIKVAKAKKAKPTRTKKKKTTQAQKTETSKA